MQPEKAGGFMWCFGGDCLQDVKPSFLQRNVKLEWAEIPETLTQVKTRAVGGCPDLPLVRTESDCSLPTLVSNLELLAREWRAVASCLRLPGWELLERPKISPAE